LVTPVEQFAVTTEVTLPTSPISIAGGFVVIVHVGSEPGVAFVPPHRESAICVQSIVAGPCETVRVGAPAWLTPVLMAGVRSGATLTCSAFTKGATNKKLVAISIMSSETLIMVYRFFIIFPIPM
jgi:hypothetical protein